MAETKQDESFKVVAWRLFTADGELRKEVAEQQDREREARLMIGDGLNRMASDYCELLFSALASFASGRICIEITEYSRSLESPSRSRI